MSDKILLSSHKTMVVPVNEKSLSRAENELIYITPQRYRIKNVDYIAFYCTSPVCAITHYGKVENVEKGVHYSKYFKTLPKWAKGDLYLKVYHLEWIKELESKIEKTQIHNAVYGRIYVTIEKLFQSKTLDDIFNTHL